MSWEKGYSGPWAMSGNSNYYAYIQIMVTEYSTYYNIKYKYSIYKRGGSAIGTLWRSTSTHGNIGNIYVGASEGWYGDTGYYDGGNYSSGQTFSVSYTVGHTGGSGTNCSSSVTATYTVPQLQTVPQTPASCSLVLNDNNTATISWVVAATATAPITTQKIGIQINDGSWSYTTLAASARTYTFNISQNSKYYCAVQAGNNIGWGAWKYSSVGYTNPLKPTYFATYDTSNNIIVNLSSNSKYFKQFNLSYQVNENTWSDVIPVTTTTYTIPSTTTIYNNKLKIQEVNLGNKTTSWYEFIPSDRISILVNIPEGATPKSVWVKGPFAPPNLPYDVTFVKREDLPVHSLEQLTFSFSSDVRQLPSYFILCKEDGSPITKIPIEYDDEYTIVKNDNSYIYTDSNMINTIVAAFGIAIPYKLRIKLGNTLGETAPVITDKALTSNIPIIKNVIIGAASSGDSWWG